MVEESMQEGTDDVYRQLQQHLDQGVIGFPAAESGSDIRVLKAFFTPEQAEFALNLSAMPADLKSVFRTVKKKRKDITIEETEQMLKSMADEGLIFEIPNPETGEMVYFNMPLVVGFYEFHVNRLTPEIVAAQDEYEKEVYHEEFYATGLPQMRTIPIDIAITPEHQIMSYDDLWTIVDNMVPPYAVSTCICTQKQALLGHTCEHSLTERCLNNNQWFIDHGIAREVSKDELIDIIKRGRDDGLVVQPGTFKNGAFACLCCGDCCGILLGLKMFEKPAEHVWSNFHSEVDAEKCTACGNCESRCPMNAVTVGDVASVNLDRCIGCGVCVPSCSSDAIHLKQKDEVREPPENFADLYTKMMMKKAQMRMAAKQNQ
jgi:ferredoxin